MNNSFVYDVEGIIKRSELLEAKKAKIIEEFKKINSENIYSYPSSYNNSSYNYSIRKRKNLANNSNEEQIIQFSGQTFYLPCHHPDFQIEEDGKTIARIKGTEQEKVGFKLLNTIPWEGLQEISFIVHDTNNCYFYIGVMTQSTDFEKGGASSTNTSWMCFLMDGRFINAGDTKQYFSDEWKRPDEKVIITLCIDTNTNEMYIKKNFMELSKKLKMEINDTQKLNLIPCVDFKKVGDRVTIFG